MTFSNDEFDDYNEFNFSMCEYVYMHEHNFVLLGFAINSGTHTISNNKSMFFFFICFLNLHRQITSLLGVLVVLSCCAMAYVMRGHSPPGDTSACRHRTVASSYSPSSTRSRGTCCSSRPYKQFDQKSVNSDTSCSTNRMGQY